MEVIRKLDKIKHTGGIENATGPENKGVRP
jgi:hypothetical protein